jgi:putative membrane protein (TIGR04086 family)
MQKSGKLGKNALFYGYLNAIILSILLGSAFSIAIYYSNLSESHLKTFSAIIIFISVFWGGLKTSQNTESRALFYGMGIGLAYLLTTIVITFLISEPITGKVILNRLLYCIGGGAIGGIVGAFMK